MLSLFSITFLVGILTIIFICWINQRIVTRKPTQKMSQDTANLKSINACKNNQTYKLPTEPIQRNETSKDTWSKCEYCHEILDEESDQQECCECEDNICTRCGIIEKGILESEASYICRDCIPVKCNECNRILIDENVWEEDIEYCNDCEKPFCSYNLSPNCVQEIIDTSQPYGYGETGIYECRNCIQKPKILTTVDTLQKYEKYLDKGGEDTLEEWVRTQGDPSTIKVVNNQTLPRTNIARSCNTKEEIRMKLLNSHHCMTRQMILGVQQIAANFGRHVYPLKCKFCNSSEKSRYFMLRTHFIEYACLDCEVENEIGMKEELHNPQYTKQC
eukprot:120840_1